MTFAVHCPHCGSERAVTQDDAVDVEPPVACFRCGREFFASEAILVAHATGPERKAAPLEVACPRCRAPRPVPHTNPGEPLPCRRCGRVFTLRDAETRGRRRRRRRPPPDPARALGWPANVLYVFAGLELVLYALGALLAVALFGPNLKQAFNNVNPDPRAVAAIVIMVVGMSACLFRDVLIIVGARQMIRRHSYGLAVAGVVAAFVPIGPILGVIGDAMVARGPTAAAPCNGCMMFGWVALGVWAVVALNRPGVSQRFGNPPPPWPPRERPPEPDDYIPTVDPEPQPSPPPAAPDTTTP